MGSPTVSLPDPWSATGLKTVSVQPTDPWASTGLKTVPVDASAGGAADGGPADHSAAGGSRTPTIADDIAGSRFAQVHPLLAKYAAEPAADALQGVGTALTGDAIRLAHYASPKLGDYLQRKIGVAAEPIPGQGLGRFLGHALEFAAPGGAEEDAARAASELLPEAARAGRVIARMIPYAAVQGGIAGLQGGNPAVGAALGAGGEGAAQALRGIAPSVARFALGLRRGDFAYGADPATAALEHLSGITPGAVESSARRFIGNRMQTINDIADKASEPVTFETREPLALPPGPQPVERMPLHEAAAMVERPSMLQPAAKDSGGFVGVQPGQLPRTVNGRVIERPQAFTSATAADVMPPATWQLPSEQRATSFLGRLESEGGGGVTYPGGAMPEGAVAHPLQEPLRTIRRAEPAQGVWMRLTGEPIAEPLHGGGAPSVAARPRSVIGLGDARRAIDDEIEQQGARNNATALNTLGRVRSQLTQRALTGEPIPSEVTPREALELKRGVREQFGKYRTEPQYDHSVASHAAKKASRVLDHALDAGLGPEFTKANEDVHDVLPIVERAQNRALGEDFVGRTLHRVAAHTGALTGAGVGAMYGGREGGPGGALKYGTLGLLGPEVLASPEFGMAGARLLYGNQLGRIASPIVQAAAAAATKKKGNR